MFFYTMEKQNKIQDFRFSQNQCNPLKLGHKNLHLTRYMRSRCVCLCEINRNGNIKYIEKHKGTSQLSLGFSMMAVFLFVTSLRPSYYHFSVLGLEPFLYRSQFSLASIIATFSVIAPAMQLMNSCAVLPLSWPIKENLNSQDFLWLDLRKSLAPPDTVFCINPEILQKSHLANKKLIFNKNYECFAGFFKYH